MEVSRVISRLLPVAEGDVSYHDAFRRGVPGEDDIEAHPRPFAPEHFHDEEDDPDTLLYDQRAVVDGLDSPESSPEVTGIRKWLMPGKRRADEDEDVPESLILGEGGKTKADAARNKPLSRQTSKESRSRTEAQWRSAQTQDGLQPGLSKSTHLASNRRQAMVAGAAVNDPTVAAIWQWTNVQNLDAFLLEVYQYYVGHGKWSILLAKALNMLTELFVFGFAMFLTTCIDYSKLPTSKSMSEVRIPKCMAKAPWWKNFALFAFVIYWCIRLVNLAGDLRRLSRMHDFYAHALGIANQDIQTVSWVRVVDGLVKLHNENIYTADQTPAVKKYVRPGKAQQRISAETVANRLMRQDNYYVAMYNKDIFDFVLPLPFIGPRHFYSKSLEWCIDFCLTNFIFDEQGSIRPFCLDVRNRAALVQALRVRLQFAALASVVMAPFTIVRFCIMFFFRYYTEFTRNPAKASARSFTPFAEWKIREFNELDHLFERRLRQAYQPANQYLRQFPKDKVDQFCRFLAFVSGAVAAILTLATLFDPELFLGFEITPGRTAVFWLTLAVGVFGFAQGQLPDEDEVHDPVLHLRAVLYFTHYVPGHWKDRLHSTEVRSEFSAMYQVKILIFVEEILSLIVTPWILLRNASMRSERIIDFFREQTVHVEGIGNQCNFAVFGFKKDPNVADPTTVLEEPDGLRDDYFGLKDDKMAVSMHNFMQIYNHHQQRQGRKQGWQPPPAWPSMLSPSALPAGHEVHGALHPHHAGVRQHSSASDRPSRQPKSTRPSSLPGPTSIPLSPAFDKRKLVGSPGLAPVTESVMMQNDSDLQDVVHPARDHLESDTEAEDDADNVGKAGVLGMLYQYSKAQTEKGTGVNI